MLLFVGRNGGNIGEDDLLTGGIRTMIESKQERRVEGVVHFFLSWGLELFESPMQDSSHSAGSFGVLRTLLK